MAKAIIDSEGADVLLRQWSETGSDEAWIKFLNVLPGLVRRQVGELLCESGVWMHVDSATVAGRLTSQLGVQLGDPQSEQVRNAITRVASEVLDDEEPKEVTRLLWMLGAEGVDTKTVPNELLQAIDTELRRRIRRMLRRSNFVGMTYKIEQGDLVSELYLKLLSKGIPRLPANRWQFFSLVDHAIESILLDMQKTAHRLMRPPTREKEKLIDVHRDTRQDPLQALLDAEDPGGNLALRLELKKHIAKLPERQQKIFRLKINGVSQELIADILDCSTATIKREWSKAWAQVTLSVSESSPPAK